MTGPRTTGWKELPRPPKETPRLYAQDGKGYGATVHAHYFLGDNDWLVTEYDPGEDLAFGWACLGGDRDNAELGYVSIAELAAVAAPMRLHDVTTGQVTTVPGAIRVEQDEDWEPCTITEAIALLDQRQGRDGGR